MKKDFLMSVVVAALVVFGVKTYYEKKVSNSTQVSTVKEVSNEVSNQASNEDEMLVSGYALGEIPAITAPEMPDLSVKENPNAKITLDMTQKISAVPGINVTPVKVENGNIVGGDYSIHNGDGEYTDENLTIKRNKDG